MKKLIAIVLLAAFTVGAQAQDIKLRKPRQDKERSMSVTEALATRHSVRQYKDKELSKQQISNLCWAACGRSRDANHITSPTALNKQEIRLFVFTKKGVYEYNSFTNRLVEKAKGDRRRLVADKQDFVMQAPVSLVMVIDFDKFLAEGSITDHARMMCCVDAGIVSENINLYCQSVGLATVPRASMDVLGIQELLGFTDRQLPIMNNPVGYEVK